MLSSADRDLVRRDRAISGLATVLDPEAMVELLRTHLPQASIRDVEIHYVRYKPGVNCLVGYTLNTAEGNIDLYAKAYGAASDGKHYKLPDPCTHQPMLGAHSLIVEDLALTINVFPCDRRLGVLNKLHSAQSREQLLRKMLPNQPRHWQVRLQKLRYKPERRYVASALLDNHPQLVLKCYGLTTFDNAYRNAKRLTSTGPLRLARCLGRSRRHRVLAFEWIAGRPLSKMIAEHSWREQDLALVGAALGSLHQQKTKRLHSLTRTREARTLEAVALWLGTIHPDLQQRYHAVGQVLSASLLSLPPQGATIHGDFYAEQVLIDTGDKARAALVDLDCAARGDRAMDLGNFLGHLQRDVILGKLDADTAERLRASLLQGYRESAPLPDNARIQLYIAAALLRLAPECFRRRLPDWPQQLRAHMDTAEAQLASLGGVSVSVPKAAQADTTDSTPVIDPFGISADPLLEFADAALDPLQVASQLRQHLPEYLGRLDRLRVEEIRVLRHKPGLRCLLQYRITHQMADGTQEDLTLMGKIKARRPDKPGYRLLKQLWSHDFNVHSADGIGVPEPMGLIRDWHMLLQRRVPGIEASEALAQAGDTRIATRIAEAVHKLHRIGIPAQRRHGIDDELRILAEHLDGLARQRPDWSERLERILQACTELAQASTPQAPCGIHRDFYPDQVLVDDDRLYLLDLDLYTEGEAVLDVGNFIAHLMELGLRTRRDPWALNAQMHALEQRFLELNDESCQPRLQTYVTLSLARHISLSTRFEERKPFTMALMALCEQRLGIGKDHRSSERFISQI